jgi:predicted GNAT superfamily acetyltransferase
VAGAEAGGDRINLDAVLELNRRHETETSVLDEAALRALLAEAFHVGFRAGGRDAFLIALDETAPSYASPNYRWFRERYSRFVYVDRVIVAPASRGRGVARELYRDLFAAARQAGQDVVGCEVNLVPPNPASLAFHFALGFAEVGRSAAAGSSKRVRYLARNIRRPTAR